MLLICRSSHKAGFKREDDSMKRIAALILGMLLTFSVAACPSVTVFAQEGLPDGPNCNIIYDLGNGQYYAITKPIAMSMMMTNPDGSYYLDPNTQYYVVDEAKVDAFLSGLDSLYAGPESNTLLFHATRGEDVQVEGGTMTKRFLDEDTEFSYLGQAIMEQRQEVHVPQYGIGKTYIELDMTTQNLYYYKNGTLVLETPIVTGKVSSGNGSPTGVYYVRGKSRNVTLISSKPKNDPGYYESFVNYWVPFVGNSVGIHDATWRSNFGGNIYQSSGSHGCINVPLSNMEKLFPETEVGTPVVAFY